jgi:hypothetical protein
VLFSKVLPVASCAYSADKTVLSNGLAVPRSCVDEPLALIKYAPDTFVKARKPSIEEEEEGAKTEDNNTAVKIVVGIAAVALVSWVVAWLIQQHKKPPLFSKPKNAKPQFMQEMQERIKTAREQQEEAAERFKNNHNNPASPFPPDFDDSWEGYNRDPNWTPFGTYKPPSTPCPNSVEDLFNQGFWDDLLNDPWSGSNTGASTWKPPSNPSQQKPPSTGPNQSNSTNYFNYSDFIDSTRSKYPEYFDGVLKHLGLSKQQYEDLSLKELKKAKIALFKKLHPDKNRDKPPAEQKRIEEAFKIANNVLEWMEKDKGG